MSEFKNTSSASSVHSSPPRSETLDHLDVLESEAVDVLTEPEISNVARDSKKLIEDEKQELKAEVKELKERLELSQAMHLDLWIRFNEMERRYAERGRKIKKLEGEKLTLQVENALLFLDNKNLGGNFPRRPDAEDFELV